MLHRTIWLRLGTTFVILGLAAALVSPVARSSSWWLHGLWCGVGLIAVYPPLKRILKRNFRSVLTDHLIVFTAAFAIYFLLGALLLSVGPAEQVELAQAYYRTGAASALRVDAVNGVGFGVALLAASLSSGAWLGGLARRVARPARRIPPGVVILIFLVVGIVASFRVLAIDLGLRDGLASGTARTASNFVLVAIVLASAHRGRHEKVLRAAAIALAAIETVAGLLIFNKTATLLPILSLTLGLSLRFRARRIVPAGLAAAAGIFLLIGGMVSYGRNVADSSAMGNMSARWRILDEALRLRTLGSIETRYHPWVRFCYVPSQAAALDYYDRGWGGDELRLVPWLFVPRALAAEKPSITQAAADFHTKITGRTGSSTGQGIFVSGYYNAGWMGALVASLLCGWLLAQTSAIASAVVQNRALILLPFVLLGVYMAFRIDGHFLSDYLGPFVFILYPLLCAAFVTEAVGAQRPGLP